MSKLATKSIKGITRAAMHVRGGKVRGVGASDIDGRTRSFYAELRPCAFCGGEATIVKDQRERNALIVQCTFYCCADPEP